MPEKEYAARMIVLHLLLALVSWILMSAPEWVSLPSFLYRSGDPEALVRFVAGGSFWFLACVGKALAAMGCLTAIASVLHYFERVSRARQMGSAK